MPELLTDGDRRMIAVGPFRVAFTWTGDRWAHALEHREPGAASHRVLALSLEGDPDRDDPARVVSPTYQDLQFQEVGHSMQALLVGRSGPHHFSAVFTVGRGDQAEAREWPRNRPREGIYVDVDVADRCRAPVEALASTYTVDADSGDLIQAMENLAAWDIGPGRLTFYADHGSPTRVGWGEAGRRATRVQALARLDPAGATHRFVYNWHWEPDLRTAPVTPDPHAEPPESSRSTPWIS